MLEKEWQWNWESGHGQKLPPSRSEWQVNLWSWEPAKWNLEWRWSQITRPVKTRRSGDLLLQWKAKFRWDVMSRFDHGVHGEKKINNFAAGLLPPLVFHDSASFLMSASQITNVSLRLKHKRSMDGQIPCSHTVSQHHYTTPLNWIMFQYSCDKQLRKKALACQVIKLNIWPSTTVLLSLCWTH